MHVSKNTHARSKSVLIDITSKQITKSFINITL